MTEPPTICLNTREVRALLDRSAPVLPDGELVARLDRARDEGKLNRFFDDHPFSYDFYRELGDYGRCVSACEELLEQIKKVLGDDKYRDLHKGTPFYWMGASLFVTGDYERAIFYMDAAVSEDIGTNGEGANTPAIRFVTLNDEEWHAAAPLLKRLKNRITDSLDAYNGIRPEGRQPMTLETVIERFIKPLALDTQNPKHRSLPTAFLSFFAEWEDRKALMELRPDAGTSEPFFMHLFKGCLLFESLLKANGREPIPDLVPKNNKEVSPTLSDVFDRLSSCLHIGPKPRTSANSFADVLGLVKGQGVRTIRSVVEHTAKARNTLGHNLGWEVEGLDSTTYSRLTEDIASACLHAIAYLYVPENPPAAQ